MRFLVLGLFNLLMCLLGAIYITAWFSVFGAISLQNTTMLIVSCVIISAITAGYFYVVRNFEFNDENE